MSPSGSITICEQLVIYIICYRRETFKFLHNTLLSITKFLYKNVRKNMLEVKNIHKKFGTNEVLKGVDFKVEKGSVIAVTGKQRFWKGQPFSAVSQLSGARQIKGEITFD